MKICTGGHPIASLLLAALFASAPVAAQSPPATLAISFEATPGPDGLLGTADDVPAPNATTNFALVGSIGEQYRSLGAIFRTTGSAANAPPFANPATLFANAAIFPGSPPGNHFLSGSGRYAVDFLRPVSVFTIDSASVWRFSLIGFDSASNAVARADFDQGAPNPGGDFRFVRAELTSAVPMSRVAIVPDVCSVAAGTACNAILNLDNLSVRFAGAPEAVGVPVDSLWMGVSVALLLLATGVAGVRRPPDRRAT